MTALTSDFGLPLFVVGANAAVLLMVLAGVRAAAVRLDWPHRARTRFAQALGGALIVWFVLTILLALEGFFARRVGGYVPGIAFGAAIPLLVAAPYVLMSKKLGAVIAETPQSALVGVQVYRVIGIVFLLLLAEGRLPPEFALPAGWGDIAVGVAAPLVALLAMGRAIGGGFFVLIWNLFGMVDLLLAVALGFATSPGPFQWLAHDAPNTLMTAYPMVVIPVFIVPLSMLLHLASLRKLAQQRRV